MEIKKLNLKNEEECSKWEEFVLKNGYIYQSIKWCNVLKEGYNIEPVYLYLDDNNEILSLLPLFHVKFSFLLDELVSIPHVEAGGFINPEYNNYFLEYILKNIKIKNLKIYQFEKKIGEFPNNDINSLFMVNMPESMEDLYKYLKKGFKRSIKNILEKTDVIVEKGNSDKFIEILYKLNIIKNKEFGTPHHSYNFIKAIVKNFKDNSIIFIAKKNGLPVGASFIVFYGNIGYHFYHFVPVKYLKIKVGQILYFNVFKEAFDRGMEKFSFGRSPKGSGVYKFKTQMHATPYPLYIYNFIFKGNEIKPEKIKILSEKYSWIADIWSKLPSPITNFLSPRLRKWVY